jgi:hypothetical protein
MLNPSHSQNGPTEEERIQHLRLLARTSAFTVLTAGSAMAERLLERGELLLELRRAPHDLTAQVPVPAKRRPLADEAVRIAFALDHLHLFDAASGQSILL